jgi:hypothetical protein
MNDAKYIGLDVHQATISVAILDSAGKLVMEAILEIKTATIIYPLIQTKSGRRLDLGRRPVGTEDGDRRGAHRCSVPARLGFDKMDRP